MFVTVNELVGVPGLPTTQQGLRYSLKKSAGNSPELVRKRALLQIVGGDKLIIPFC
ncbi:Uncharacterised protein [Klebsiella pneumoniae]|nr:Uncharacterised protein [Klebsiella pneumoniae]